MVVLAGRNRDLVNSINRELSVTSPVVFYQCGDNYIQALEDIKKIFRKERPDAFVNCYHYDDIEDAQYLEEHAYNINALFTKEISRLCASMDVFFFQVSTSWVFAGDGERPLVEEDEALPLTVYGDSMLLGEHYVRDSGSGHCILRLPDLYSHEEHPLNWTFVSLKGRELELVKGHRFSPCSVADAASAVAAIFQKKVSGIFHYGPDNCVSCMDYFALLMSLCREHGSTAGEMNIIEVDKRESGRAAEIPCYNVLDNSKFRSVTGIVPDTWQKCLKRYVDETINSKGALI